MLVTQETPAHLSLVFRLEHCLVAQADVQAGQQLLERWAMRNEAIAQLEAVMDEVSGPVISQSSPSRGQQGRLYPCMPRMFMLTPLHSLSIRNTELILFIRLTKLQLVLQAATYNLNGLQVSSCAVCNHGHAHLPLTIDPAIQHANPSLTAGPTVADHEALWAEWALRIRTLERGIEQARQQGISVSRAKRVLKELQAQANAAEAAAKLEALLLRKPCKASLLKVSPSMKHVVP